MIEKISSKDPLKFEVKFTIYKEDGSPYVTLNSKKIEIINTVTTISAKNSKSTACATSPHRFSTEVATITDDNYV